MGAVWTRRMVALWASALWALCWGTPDRVRAYSSFGDYTRAIQEGGGGGRLFTGTPADPYGCDVCHTGARGAALDVLGLPADGYVPGQSYEVTLAWPATTAHVALMAEFTDVAGRPSGTTALAPYATWQAGELCEGGAAPAADVCRDGDLQSGCCRDLEPGRDTCSFPGERSVLWVLDCGSRFARVLWTAPPGGGDVWFSAAMVTSDVQNDPLGDGATSARTLLRPAGASRALDATTGSCQVLNRSRSTAPLAWLWLAALGALLRRRLCILYGGKRRNRP